MNTKMIAALLAATALSSVSAFAGPVRFTGDLYVGAGAQFGTTSDVDDQDPLFAGGKGSLFVPFNNTKLSATIDLFVEHGDGILDDSNNERDYTGYGGAVHFTYTQGNRYSLGVVGSVFSTEAPEDEDPDYFLLAGEGKFMLERGSLWGQVGFFDSMNDDDTSPDYLQEVSYARMGINYYLEDNLKLGAEAGFYEGQVEFEDPAPFSIYRVELEQTIAGRFSIYGAYSYLTMDNQDEDDNAQANVFNIGMRFRLGDGDQGTLMSQEQTNSIGVPPVLHAIGLSNYFD